MKRISLLLGITLLFTVVSFAQLSGTYSIGTGNVPGENGHFATLKAACDSITASSGANITGDCLFYITSDLTEPVNVALGPNTNGHTITFKPYTGVSPVITFTQTTDNAGLSGGWAIGVKNITTTSATNYGMTQADSVERIVIDGSNTPGGTTRDLTIRTAAGIHANTNPIRIFGNTNYITIKNVVIATGQSVSYAVLITVRQTATAGYAGNYVPDNITVDNCDVTNTFGAAGQGIAISNSGTPTQFPTNVVFSNNKVTATTRGIFLNYAGNTDVFGNQIYLNQTGTGSLSEGIFAFVVGSASHVTNIYNNKILFLSTANTTAGSFGIEGIWIATQGIYNIYNNIVTGFKLPNLTQGIHTGIGISSSTVNGLTVNVYNNSVYMGNGSNTAGTTAPTQAAFYMNMSGASGTRVANVKNNIFVTDEPDYATYAMFVPATNQGTLTSDYNALYAVGGSSKIGRFGATECTTLADWQTASSKDANSKSGVPQFVSDSDLHIKTTAYPVSVSSNAGTPLADVTKDIDGDLRDASTPDIGADEFVAAPIIPTAGFEVNPLSLSFGNVWKDSVQTDSLFVKNISTTLMLSVDSVRSTNPVFTVQPDTADIDTSGTKAFVVKFSPVAKGVQQGSIIFYHNAPSKIDTVPVTGNGIIKEPLFSVIPSVVNFNGVLLTKSKQDSVVVKNTGTDVLTISSVTSYTPSYTVTPTSAQLDTNATTTFYITFTPTVAGNLNGAIRFTSNAASSVDSVIVLGTGLSAVSISEARKDVDNDLKPDYAVTKDTLVVAGVVISANLQTTGTSYFIQDATAGIDVFSFNPAPAPLAIGDSIIVVGTILQFRGLTEITPLTLSEPNLVLVKKNATVPSPKRLTLKEFVLHAEQYEGQLVEVDSLFKATGTWPAAGANGSVYLTNLKKTDTIQVFIDLDTPLDGSVEPTYPVNIVGIVSQYSSSSSVFNNGYELMPRDSNDIKHIVMTSVDDALAGIPDQFALFNNYPNPFNPSTTIRFALPFASSVSLKIYDAVGREVATVVNEKLEAGYHRIQWNAHSLSTGVYYYRLTARSGDGNGSFTDVKKLMLLK